MNIIDRRQNPKGKSLPNRQRFLERAKADVRRAVGESIHQRAISDVDPKERVKVKTSGTAEPSFQHGKGGAQDLILPGNKEFVKGDQIQRPPAGEGRGRGNAAPEGEGMDPFEFTLSRDEFLDVFFEDLELPDLIKQNLTNTPQKTVVRSGHRTSGSPVTIHVVRTMRNAISRRFALKRPLPEHIQDCEAQLAEAKASNDQASIEAIEQQLILLRQRQVFIPWIDPIDVRYHRFDHQSKPNANAVMFCLMDVSGSMTEHMKDLAKRFYMLLYLFLERKYEKVSLVFIRHTHEAQEVDEETFFRSKETGGTVVSTALEVMLDVQEKRYPLNEWNIYVAQASDGDNMESDRAKTIALMQNRILPITQYFAYIETTYDHGIRESDLWKDYKTLQKGNTRRLNMRKVGEINEIWSVFAELFAKNYKE